MLLFILLYFFVSINIARCVTTADQCGNNHVVLGTACPKMVTEARRGKETIGELRLAAVATCIAWEWMKCKFGWCMWSLRFVHTYSAHTHIILECIMYIDTREYLYTIHCSCEERCVCMVVSMCGYTLCVCVVVAVADSYLDYLWKCVVIRHTTLPPHSLLSTFLFMPHLSSHPSIHPFLSMLS